MRTRWPCTTTGRWATARRSHGAPVSEASAPAAVRTTSWGTRAAGSWRRSRSSASAATGPASTRPTPPARSSEVEGLRKGALAADDDVLAAPGGEQRVTVTGQPVGRRQGVGVRAQGGPPGLAEVTQEGAVGRQVEQQVPFAQRLQQPRHPPRRDAGPRGQGVQGGQIQAAVQPRDQRHLGVAQALKDDAGVAGRPHLQRAAPPAQQLCVRLEPGSGRHAAPSWGRGCWDGDSGTREPRTDAAVHREGRPGQNKGRDPSRARGPALWLFGGSGLAEDAVEVGAAHGARALGHATAVRLDDPALGLALLLALHAVESPL